MPTDFSVNKRDLQFVLYEQFPMDELCALPAFAEFNRETFDMVLSEAIKVAVEVLAPLNAPGDREGCTFDKGAVRTPKGFQQAYQQFAAGAWNGMVHSPEYGGQGLPNMLRSACAEVFAGSNVAFFLTSILTEGTAHLIESFGTDELKKIYCEKMYTGEWGGTMCLTEPGAGSDVGNLKTVARKNGDHYLITGQKIFITSGEHDLTPNIIHAVLARIEGAPAGTKGISLFLVPKFLVNADGSLGERNDVCCAGIEHKMGIKASPTCTLSFGDEGRCRGWLLGQENGGMKAMFQMMNEARLGVGVQGLALAAAGYLAALAYAKERTQGSHFSKGKDPTAPRTAIIEHPDIRRSLLHMKALTDGMRSMMLFVARAIDLSQHSQSETEREQSLHLVELLTPICKAYGSDQGFRVNEMAIQVFGGYGYCQEYPVEQYCRDQKIASIYEGTNGIQAMDLLGRKVLGSGGAYAREFASLVSRLIERHARHPVLGPLAAKLNESLQELTRVTFHLAGVMQKDPALALSRATPYLEMFGHVAVAYFLLHGAGIAAEKLDGIAQREGAADEAARRKLAAGNVEAAFYFGRVASARYFVSQVLPQVAALGAAITDGDQSPLEMVFSN